MTVGMVLGILQWVLPLLKAGVTAFTKANLPQELIDAASAAVTQIQKVIDIGEPTRAQVLALDIDSNAWGPAPTK